jgi:hypothetical protein
VLAASRAGLVTAMVLLLGLAVLERERPALRRLSIGLAVALVAITMIAQAVSPLLALRLRFWHQGAWYSSGIDPVDGAEPLPSHLPPDADASVQLSVHNIGMMSWPATGKRPVKVSYHWMSEDADKVIVLDGVRTELPHDLAPGDRTEARATIFCGGTWCRRTSPGSATPATPDSGRSWWSARRWGRARPRGASCAP